jgi:hypothetical protein
MPFIPIINSRGKQPPIDPIARYRIDLNDFSVPRMLSFTINRPLAAVLDWNIGDRIVFAFGVAEDAGKIQLSRVDHTKGGNRLHQNGAGKMQFVVSITPPKIVGGYSSTVLLKGMPQSGEVPFEVRNGSLLLTMPRPRIQAVGLASEIAA